MWEPWEFPHTWKYETCKNMCLCINAFVFACTLRFLAAYYVFWAHITKNTCGGLHWHRKDCHVTSTLQDVEQKKTVMCTQTQTHLNTNTYFKHKHKHMFLQHIGNIIAVCKDSYVVVVLTKTGNHSQNQNDIEKMTLQKWHCKNDVAKMTSQYRMETAVVLCTNPLI